MGKWPHSTWVLGEVLGLRCPWLRVLRCLGSPPLLFHLTNNKCKFQQIIIQANNKFHPSEHHGPGSSWPGVCEGHFQPHVSNRLRINPGRLPGGSDTWTGLGYPRISSAKFLPTELLFQHLKNAGLLKSVVLCLNGVGTPGGPDNVHSRVLSGVCCEPELPSWSEAALSVGHGHSNPALSWGLGLSSSCPCKGFPEDSKAPSKCLARRLSLCALGGSLFCLCPPWRAAAWGPLMAVKYSWLRLALHSGETEARMALRLTAAGSESRLGLGAVASMARSALRAKGA